MSLLPVIQAKGNNFRTCFDEGFEGKQVLRYIAVVFNDSSSVSRNLSYGVGEPKVMFNDIYWNKKWEMA